MKYAIRIVLVLLIAFLAYKTYNSVAEPVKYAKEVVIKEDAVIQKLKTIRDGQMAYKEVHGKFTGSFDTLLDFMSNGQLEVISAFGDQDDSTTVFSKSISFVSVKDSMFSDVDISNLRFVPEKDTLQFLIESGKIEKNGVWVPVFQVTDPDPYSKERLKEDNPLRVGNMYDADYSGNWGNR
ncbi:MAG: hypothetical protein JXR19_11925 [Bacteroidia bacterium]